MNTFNSELTFNGWNKEQMEEKRTIDVAMSLTYVSRCLEAKARELQVVFAKMSRP